MKFKYLASLAVAAGLLLAGNAQAAFINLVSGINIFEDDNIEYVLDAQGNVKTTGTLVVGDTLIAVVTFTEVQDGSNNTIENLAGSTKEITGISYLEIKEITAGGVVIFGASATFEALYGTGALVALFSHDPGDLDLSCHSATVADCITPATNGDPYLTAGLLDADDFWIASTAIAGVPLDAITLQFVGNEEGVTKIAVANYALSVLENNTGFDLGQQTGGTQQLLSAIYGIGPDGDKDGFVDIIGSGDVLGGRGLIRPWIARSDFDFQIYVQRVPEPATLALLGLGMLGLGAASRRRRPV